MDPFNKRLKRAFQRPPSPDGAAPPEEPGVLKPISLSVAFGVLDSVVGR